MDKSLLQSSLTSDLESNIYYSYSEFNETSTSNIGKTITSGSRDINNINSFVTLDSSKNIYLFGYSDKENSNDANNIIVKIEQRGLNYGVDISTNTSVQTLKSEKNITFHTIDTMNFDFGTVNDYLNSGIIDDSFNIYISGSSGSIDNINETANITLAKVSQTNNIMNKIPVIRDISYGEHYLARNNEVANIITMDNSSVLNIYLGGHTNIDTPTLFNNATPIIYKIRQDIDNSLFMVDTSLVYRDFGNKNDMVSDMIIDPDDGSNLLLLISIQIMKIGIGVLYT